MSDTARALALDLLSELASFCNQQSIESMSACSCCDGLGIDAATFSLGSVVVDKDVVHADGQFVVPRHPNRWIPRLAGLATEYQLQFQVHPGSLVLQALGTTPDVDGHRWRRVEVPRAADVPFEDVCRELYEKGVAAWMGALRES